MKYIFMEYPKCSTCKKAKSHLKELGICFEERNIVLQNPTYEELKRWYEMYGVPLKKYFNTSGILYRQMGLKDKLTSMSDEEQLRLLGTNGMLLKRPILLTNNCIMIGYRKELYDQL